MGHLSPYQAKLPALECDVMFIREKRRTNKDGSVVTYLQLVESRRVEGKTRQRVLCTLGRLDDPTLSRRLKGLVETASRYAEVEQLVLSRGVRARTATWGPHLVWGRLWGETVGPIVEGTLGNERASKAVYLMVLHRLCDPGSKCACFRFAKDVYGAGFEGLGLHDLYRALDALAAGVEEIERGWLSRVRDLFTDLELVYFDTTSTYVEGSHPEGLVSFGYSRDRRPDRRQLSLGVVVTREGLPVAHLVLPGRTADPVAFREAISCLGDKLGLRKVVVVCDRGMVSEGNLAALKEAGLSYIVAVRMRKEKGLAQAVLSHPGRYREVAENLKVKEVAVPGEEDRYILCYNPLGAEEDRRAREAIVAHLEERIASGEVNGLLKGAARRYVRVKGGRAELDRGKIEADGRYDGKWVLRTNTDLPPEEVARAYKGLWQVEECFRTLKTPLELRPIYHWTEARIRGHVVVCFLAFLLRQSLRLKLAELGWEGNFGALVSALSRVRAVEIEDGAGVKYRLRDEIPRAAMPAFKALKMAPPKLVEKLG